MIFRKALALTALGGAMILAGPVADAVVAANVAAEDEIDRRLGPWLDLRGGGVAVGRPQGVVTVQPDGSATGAYGALEGAEVLPARYPDVELHVGDISRPDGGYFYPPHRSHQNGLDADLLFVGETRWRSVLDADGAVSARFDFELNWEYWRAIVGQRMRVGGRDDSVVSMILVDPAIKAAVCAWAASTGRAATPEGYEILRRLRPTAGHDDHFHIRLRCSPYHVACEGDFAPPRTTGC